MLKKFYAAYLTKFIIDDVESIHAVENDLNTEKSK